MTSSRHVAMSGGPGTGTTTVGRLVADLLGATYVSSGLLYREFAAERGLTLDELNLHQASVDDEIDIAQARLSLHPEPVVLDARMGWRFLRPAFRVLLTADARAVADRLARRDGAADTLRADLERRRFEAAYVADVRDCWNHDLICDTTTLTPADVAAAIVTARDTWQGGLPVVAVSRALTKHDVVALLESRDDVVVRALVVDAAPEPLGDATAGWRLVPPPASSP